MATEEEFVVYLRITACNLSSACCQSPILGGFKDPDCLTSDDLEAAGSGIGWVVSLVQCAQSLSGRPLSGLKIRPAYRGYGGRGVTSCIQDCPSMQTRSPKSRNSPHLHLGEFTGDLGWLRISEPSCGLQVLLNFLANRFESDPMGPFR